MNNQTPPPMPPLRPKTNKSFRIALIIVGIFIAFIVGEGILTYITRHNGMQAKRILTLKQKDSVELNKGYLPSEGTTPNEMLIAVKNIKSCGKMYEDWYSSYDSNLVKTDPNIRALAQYNQQKSDELLKGLTPLYRVAFAKWLNNELKSKNPFTEVTLADSGTTLLVYSVRYTNQDERNSDYPEYGRFIEGLGFKKAIFGITPGKGEYIRTY